MDLIFSGYLKIPHDALLNFPWSLSSFEFTIFADKWGEHTHTSKAFEISSILRKLWVVRWWIASRLSYLTVLSERSNLKVCVCFQLTPTAGIWKPCISFINLQDGIQRGECLNLQPTNYKFIKSNDVIAMLMLRTIGILKSLQKIMRRPCLPWGHLLWQ